MSRYTPRSTFSTENGWIKWLVNACEKNINVLLHVTCGYFIYVNLELKACNSIIKVYPGKWRTHSGGKVRRVISHAGFPDCARPIRDMDLLRTKDGWIFPLSLSCHIQRYKMIIIASNKVIMSHYSKAVYVSLNKWRKIITLETINDISYSTFHGFKHFSY